MGAWSQARGGDQGLLLSIHCCPSEFYGSPLGAPANLPAPNVKGKFSFPGLLLFSGWLPYDQLLIKSGGEWGGREGNRGWFGGRMEMKEKGTWRMRRLAIKTEAEGREGMRRKEEQTDECVCLAWQPLSQSLQLQCDTGTPCDNPWLQLRPEI